jgi:predicted nucleic acid-binding protein
MKRVVLDASVVLKWFLPDEEESRTALEFLEKHLAGEIQLVAPSLLEYEVLNGLLYAGKKGRIKEDIVRKAAEGLAGLGIELRPPSARVLKFAGAFGISIYDAAYLAVAEAEGCPLITADNRFFAAIHKGFPLVKKLIS